MKINYVQGDLFALLPNTPIPKYIPHVVNNIGRMGSGFVVPLNKKWPVTKTEYSEWHSNGLWSGGYGMTAKRFELGEYQTIIVEPQPTIVVVNMIGQAGVVDPIKNPKPIKYWALAKCMKELGEQIAKGGNAEIHAPKFGSLRAGGNWDFILELIEESWLAKHIPVTIYEYKE